MSVMIKDLRLERGWSQEQLADCLGLSVRTVQRLENGQTPGLESAKALAAVFERQVSDFLPAPKPEDPAMTPTTNTPPAVPVIDEALRQAVAREEREEREARRYVTEVKAFFGHVAMFALIMPMLVILNLWTSPDYYWFFWPLLGWLIGIAGHAAFTFDLGSLISNDWENRTYQKKLERIRRRNQG